MILLNPGPVNLSERVRRALLAPDLCHREKEFAELQDEVRTRLLAVYNSFPQEWAPVLLSGSGSAALEAMLTSLVPAAGRLLVIENGVYGERLSQIARIHRIPALSLHFEWGAEIDLERVEHALETAPCFTHVALVHHETTTGRLNEIAGIAALCRAKRIGLLLDAVSSFGAERLDFESDGIQACAATANKCLHAAPGLSFVLVRRGPSSFPSGPPRTLYVDLNAHCQAQDRFGTLFTPAVPLFYALREALRELADEGGWRLRAARYRRLAERLRAGLARLGIEPLLAPEASSAVLRSYKLPPGLDYDMLHDGLKRRGFVIYAGQEALKRTIFRISTMGAIPDEAIDELLIAFEKILALQSEFRAPGPSV